MHIVKRIEWDMAHRLANHDGQCRNLHGHHYVLELTVSGLVDIAVGTSSEGMVADFGAIKDILKRHVLDPCDHACMYEQDDPVLSDLYARHPDMKHVVLDRPTTAENICAWVHRRIREDVFALGCRITRLQLWETPTNSAVIA